MNRRDLLKMLGVGATLPILGKALANETEPVELGEDVTAEVGGTKQRYVHATAGVNMQNGTLVAIDKGLIARPAENFKDINAAAIADCKKGHSTFFLITGPMKVNVINRG